jgi:CRP-like cAMP-binding protein
VLQAQHTPWSRNRILARVPEDARQHLAGSLEFLQVKARELMFDVNQPASHAWFPEDCVLSIVQVMSDGSAVETATVGFEGVVGLPLFFGAERTVAQGFCQVPGDTWRMPAKAFTDAVARFPTMHAAISRYAQAAFTQLGQSAACNRLHSARQRCARWLLSTHDRVGRDTFELTQLFLAQMLGVRRVTVTEVASALQSERLIDYVYGRMTITDRAGLERVACECYRVTRVEFDRLLEGKNDPSPLAHLRTSEGGLSTLSDPHGPAEPIPGD